MRAIFLIKDDLRKDLVKTLFFCVCQSFFCGAGLLQSSLNFLNSFFFQIIYEFYDHRKSNKTCLKLCLVYSKNIIISFLSESFKFVSRNDFPIQFFCIIPLFRLKPKILNLLAVRLKIWLY